MRKINDRIVGGIMAAAIFGGAALATVAIANAAPEPSVGDRIVVTDPPLLDLNANGLADEQEAAAAAAEQARIAAEQAAAAEAARIAAEQAAAAEAERLAAEQAAAEPVFEPEPEVVDPEPAPEPPAPPAGGPDPGAQNHTICEVLADGTQVPCQH